MERTQNYMLTQKIQKNVMKLMNNYSPLIILTDNNTEGSNSGGVGSVVTEKNIGKQENQNPNKKLIQIQ